jgi:hypothetical protein
VGQFFFTADLADLHRLLLSKKIYKSGIRSIRSIRGPIFFTADLADISLNKKFLKAKGSVPSVPSVGQFFTADLANYFPYLITIKSMEIHICGLQLFKIETCYHKQHFTNKTCMFK